MQKNLFLIFILGSAFSIQAQRYMENLDRGVVAIRQDDNRVFVSWRMLDLFGDWREEVIWRTLDNKALHIYTTIIPTQYRLPTLMHDPIYWLGVAWQNVAYNQPPHVSYYLGEGMAKPIRSRIAIVKRK